MAKILIGTGLLLVLAGLLWLVAERLGLGRLPGDVVVRGERTTIYFPIVTCILLSLLLSLVLWLVQWWRR